MADSVYRFVLTQTDAGKWWDVYSGPFGNSYVGTRVFKWSAVHLAKRHAKGLLGGDKSHDFTLLITEEGRVIK